MVNRCFSKCAMASVTGSDIASQLGFFDWGKEGRFHEFYRMLKRDLHSLLHT